MRHGIPVAGNFLQQELAILTGAVEVMLVDIQCVFPAVTELQKCFHTKVISTSAKAKFPNTHSPGVPRVARDGDGQARSSASPSRTIPNRDPAKVKIPAAQERLVAGFTTGVIFNMLGGRYRPSFRPLNDGIQTGRLRGVAGVVGCNNPKFPHDECHLAMVKELIRNDVLVVQTGCSAIACGKAGLLAPEAAEKFAGQGLQEICRAVGIPPVLHVGSCVDNSRILTACAEMVQRGRHRRLLRQAARGRRRARMDEREGDCHRHVLRGQRHLRGHRPAVAGRRERVRGRSADARPSPSISAPRGAFEPDPIKAAHLMIDHIDRKRAELGLPPPMYEVPYAPKTVEATGQHGLAVRSPEPLHGGVDDRDGLVRQVVGILEETVVCRSRFLPR